LAITVRGAETVFQAALANQVKKVVHVSSVAALGYSRRPDELLDEAYQPDMKQFSYYPYATSKRQSELVAVEYAAKGLDVSIALPSMLFGPGDTHNTSHIIKALYRREIRVMLPGSNCMVDVRDVAKGLVLIAAKGKRGERYILNAHNFLMTD